MVFLEFDAFRSFKDVEKVGALLGVRARLACSPSNKLVFGADRNTMICACMDWCTVNDDFRAKIHEFHSGNEAPMCSFAAVPFALFLALGDLGASGSQWHENLWNVLGFLVGNGEGHSLPSRNDSCPTVPMLRLAPSSITTLSSSGHLGCCSFSLRKICFCHRLRQRKRKMTLNGCSCLTSLKVRTT